jgi:hypothetical protein
VKKILFYIVVLTPLFLSSFDTAGQTNGLKFSFGAATFQMDDLKSLQKYILSTYPVEGKITSSFPPFTLASVTFVRKLYDQVMVGGGYSFSATGGKSSYADYSGFIATDMTETSHRFGAYVSYIITGGDHLDLSLNGRLNANLTTLTVESYYTIMNYSNGLNNRYRSISPSGSIATELNYHFRGFSLGLEAGYLVDLPRDLKDIEGGDALQDPYDHERNLGADWTGWQIQLTGVVWLK